MANSSDFPLISVVIPTYNRRESVERAIKSAFEQEYIPKEIIVVDDGSIDGTFEYLQSLDLPINIKRKENGGVSSARNVGIRESQGEYLAFLDSDDIWLPNKLTVQVEYLNQHKNISLVYCDEFIEVDGKRESKTRFQKNPPRSKMRYPGFVDLVPIHISSVLMRRRVFEEIGYFNESLEVHEDSEFWNRMSERYDLGFIEKPFAVYHWNTSESHLMDKRDKEKFKENSERYLDLYKQEKKRPLTVDEQEAVDRSHLYLKEILAKGD